MKVEVIAIGSEILSGFTVNTNAAFISRELIKEGIGTNYHTIIGDEKEGIKSTFEQALKRSKFIIATGGLGPTCDDHTRQVAAELFDSPLTFRSSLVEEMEKRYGKKLPSFEDQATLPEKAEIIPNSLGTASGLVFHQSDQYLILLPGVPHEMEEMFLQYTLPLITNQWHQEKKKINRRYHFSFLIESQVDPLLRQLKQSYPLVEIGIYPYRAKISVHFEVQESEQRKIQLQECENILLKEFSEYSFASQTGDLEEAVQREFIKRGITLALAESCTGGTVASRLTAYPGASNYFLGGVVSYSNSLKQKILHVDPTTLERDGAVSESVVKEMAEGVVALSGADYGIAVSGVAGPSGGTKEKPVGTVWIAISRKGGKTLTKLLHCRGSRQMIIEFTVNYVLGRLLFYIDNKNIQGKRIKI